MTVFNKQQCELKISKIENEMKLNIENNNVKNILKLITKYNTVYGEMMDNNCDWVARDVGIVIGEMISDAHKDKEHIARILYEKIEYFQDMGFPYEEIINE